MIEIKDLSFSYGKTPVLKNITTTLEEGKIYGLLGENGVGKTTLLTLLCGLKKVGGGSITTDGEDPFDRTPSLLEKQYYLPDEVMPTPLTAEGYAKERGKFWPLYDHEKFLHIMTNGLDIPSKAQFRSAIMSHTAEDSTIVISTHQVRDLENIIDPVIILDKQDVLLNASMEEISEKLFFDYGTTLMDGALFREQLPGGFLQVYPNYDGQESKVNVEALFNAVHSHKDLIKGLFTKKEA